MSHPPADGDFHLLLRDGHVPVESAQCTLRDVGVGRRVQVEGLDFDVIRDSLHPGDTLHRFLGLPLLRVACDHARKGDDSMVRGDTDLRRIETGFPLQLVQHIMLQVLVGLHWDLQMPQIEAMPNEPRAGWRRSRNVSNRDHIPPTLPVAGFRGCAVTRCSRVRSLCSCASGRGFTDLAAPGVEHRATPQPVGRVGDQFTPTELLLLDVFFDGSLADDSQHRALREPRDALGLSCR